MMSARVFLLSTACAALALVPSLVDAQQTTVAENTDGLGHFNREAYPAIATVAGFFVIAYSLYYSSVKAGGVGWRNHALWFIFDLLLALWGFFLIFGPDSLTSTAIVNTGGSNFNSPRAAIIGLQLIVQAAVGVFAIYAANAYASLAYALFGAFNALCLIGSNYLFNYNQPIWTLDQAQCNIYFQTYNLNRCHDDGYLQFLRIVGMFAIFTEGYVILVSLLAYATAIPAYPGQGAAPGHAAGYGTYGAPAGTAGTHTAGNPYNSGYAQATSGPGFVAQQAAPQGTGVPQTTTTQHTTYTTGVPATTVAH